MLCQLEDRIYFDGAAAAAATAAKDASTETSSSAQSDASTQASSGSSAQASSSEASSSSSVKDVSALISSILAADVAKGASGKEVLAVSSALGNAAELEAAAKAAGMTVVEYNPQTESLSSLLQDIQSSLNGSSAASVNFVTADNGGSGFSLVSGSSFEGTSLQTQEASFLSGVGALVSSGGSVSFSGDASLAATDAGALETALADAANLSVSFIDSDSGSLTTAKPESMTTDVYFVDSSLDNLESILASIPAGASVYTISGDGVQEITDILAGLKDVDSIHILAHGEAGAFKLGSDTIWTGSLDEYSSQIASWGNSLSTDGDILLYSCDLAADADGQALVTQIASLTHADVAASENATGAGGDWTLEFATGAIQASSLSVASYSGDLSGAMTYDLTIGTLGGEDYSDLYSALSFANSHTADTVTLTFDSSMTCATDSGVGAFSVDARSGTLTIDGVDSSSVVISGGSATGVFVIADGGNLTLENVTVTQSSSASAIAVGSDYDTASFSASNCVFTYNSNSSGSGGAIYAMGSITIDNCVFGNYETGSSAANTAYDGGCVYLASGASATISGSYFYYNEASYGAAIEVASGATATVSNCSFAYDSAYSGGDIYNDGTLKLLNCDLTSSSSISEGGSLYLDSGSSSQLIGDSFASCSSETGGAVYADANAYATILCSSFVSCSANLSETGGFGGAIEVASSGSAYGSVTIVDSTFYDNYAEVDGGAISNDGGDVVIMSCTFASNHTQGSGGAIYDDGYLTISNSIVVSNYICNSDYNLVSYDDIYFTSGGESCFTNDGYNIVGVVSNPDLFLNKAGIVNASSEQVFGADGPSAEFDSATNTIQIDSSSCAYQYIPLCADHDYNGSISIDQRGYYCLDASDSYNRDVGAYQTAATAPDSGDYITSYHTSEGNWTDSSIWLTYASSGWTLAAAAPTSGEAARITIDTGSSVYTDASTSLSDIGFLVVAPGATLTLNGSLSMASPDGVLKIFSSGFSSSSTLALANVTVSGSGSISLGSSSSTTTIESLTINCDSSANVTLSGNVEITSSLTLTSGYLKLGSNTLTIDSSATVSGASSSSFIVTDGTGSVEKVFDSTHTTFTYPIGTLNGSTGEYSPITLTYSPSSATAVPVQVVASLAPGVSSSSNHISRYWVIGDPPDISVDSAQFQASDVSGSSSSMQAQFSADGGATWSSFGSVNSGSNSFSGSLSNYGIVTAFGFDSSSSGSGGGMLNVDQQSQQGGLSPQSQSSTQGMLDMINSNSILAGFVTDGETGVLAAGGAVSFPGSMLATMFGDLPNGERGMASTRSLFAGAEQKGPSVVMRAPSSAQEGAASEKSFEEEFMEWLIEKEKGGAMLDLDAAASDFASVDMKFERHPSFMTELDRLLASVSAA